MAILDREDYFWSIPGHPDCVGMEASQWLKVWLITGHERIYVGDYPCTMPLKQVAQRVTAWKQTVVYEDDGDYDEHMGLTVKGW